LRELGTYQFEKVGRSMGESTTDVHDESAAPPKWTGPLEHQEGEVCPWNCREALQVIQMHCKFEKPYVK
jgi:hypothetical protein